MEQFRICGCAGDYHVRTRDHRHRGTGDQAGRAGSVGKTDCDEKIAAHRSQGVEESSQRGCQPLSAANFVRRIDGNEKNEATSAGGVRRRRRRVDDILRKAGNGLVIVRPIEVFNKTQQNGLLGLLREAGKNGTRVVACSAETTGALQTKKFSDILLSLLSRNVVTIPPLADYKDDMPTLVPLICRRFAEDTGTHEKTLTPEAVELLINHDYGNDFAELSFIIRSALLYGKEEKIASGVIKAFINKLTNVKNPLGMTEDIYRLPLRDARDIFEREYLYRIMDISDGNIQKAASMAGLERTYFYRRLKRHKEEDEKIT